MSGATIKSVFVKTGPSKNDDDETIGYELLKTKDDYDSSTIIQKPGDPNLTGRRHTIVSSGGVFPDDIQASMKPYFDRGGFSHHLNPSSTDTVEEQEVRVMIEAPNEDQYHVEKLGEDRYYASHDNQPVNPPQIVIQEAKVVFPNYEPL